ncbi:hypothetical protein ABFX02_03G033300 [Erythranthe guttata]
MPKLLVEFLQEQQEPFALDNYLLERGYSKGSTTSSALRNSARFLKKSVSLGLRKRREIVPKCSEFVRAVCGRFVVLHNINNHNIKNRGNSGGRRNSISRWEISEKQHASEEDKYYLSSTSGTTVFDSCSESDVGEDAHCSQVEVDAERKLKWRYTEDCNKKLCPVSILQETKEGSPFHDKGESSTTSFSQFKSKRTTTQYYYTSVEEELQELVDVSSSYSQFIINKRALQQNKQLLIDCVREVLKKYRKKDGKIFGTDELWKLVCENVWIWSKDSIDENSIIHLLRYDFMESSLQEWSTADSEQLKEDLSMLIGDAVLDCIINEFITTLPN